MMMMMMIIRWFDNDCWTWTFRETFHWILGWNQKYHEPVAHPKVLYLAKRGSMQLLANPSASRLAMKLWTFPLERVLWKTSNWLKYFAEGMERMGFRNRVVIDPKTGRKSACDFYPGSFGSPIPAFKWIDGQDFILSGILMASISLGPWPSLDFQTTATT